MREATMIFKPGGPEEIWGVQVTTATVEADDVEGHLENGWYRSITDFPEPGAQEGVDAALLAILDRPAPEIMADLPAMKVEELTALKAAEENGKTRKGVMAAIDEAIKAAGDAAV